MHRYLLSLVLSTSLALASLSLPAHAADAAALQSDEVDTGALRLALGPVLAPEAPPAVEAPPPGVPALSFEELGRLVVQAISGKSWSLLASLLLVGLVMVARKVGGKMLPWLNSARGAVFLSVAGGTSTLLALALAGGQPFSFGLLVSCFMGAASAAGIFSWGKTVRGRTPSAVPVCTPEEVANGTCKV